jgi:hypothetical protein
MMMKDIYLYEGEYIFESWDRQGRDVIMPFYVEVRKK